MDILLLDEFCPDLDPRSRRRLISLLNGFSHTKIIAGHDLDLIYETCMRIIVLKEGSIVCDDKPETVFNDDEKLEEWWLEKPLGLRGCPQSASHITDM